MKKRVHKRSCQKRGFLLFELIIALTVFVIVSSVMIQLYQCNQHQYQQALDRFEAVTLAVKKIESWQKHDHCNDHVEHKEKYTISCVEGIIHIPTPTTVSLATLWVTISWQDFLLSEKKISLFSCRELL